MTVDIRAINEEEVTLWRVTHEVTEMLRDLPWILIGGLMVRALEAERGVTTTFTTVDVDAVLDVRAVASATEEAAARLQAAGFKPERRDGGRTYRFVRGKDIVDVLVPDHLGERARRTTVPPDETLEALGSRQALNRRRLMLIDGGDGPFEVPLPSLIGAIVLKARVVGNVQGKSSQSKHERDLARLLALVRDPIQEGAELSGNERGYLRARVDLAGIDHRAWWNVTNAEVGIDALLSLGDPDPSR